MGLLERRTPKGSAPLLYSPDGERYCPLDSDIMLRIVILPAAVSPANIISQKPRGFYITFRKENITPGKARNITFVHRTVTAMQAGNMRRQGLQVCHCEEAQPTWQSRGGTADLYRPP